MAAAVLADGHTRMRRADLDVGMRIPDTVSDDLKRSARRKHREGTGKTVLPKLLKRKKNNKTFFIVNLLSLYLFEYNGMQRKSIIFCLKNFIFSISIVINIFHKLLFYALMENCSDSNINFH